MPVLERFRKWLEEQKRDVLPKSPINAAIGYVQNHWEALIRYASSGYLAIDNNVAEQHMKTIATGRKNWLFTGSENGGKTMAVLFSVVSSCQRHGHDPFVYLRDVLERLPGSSEGATGGASSRPLDAHEGDRCPGGPAWGLRGCERIKRTCAVLMDTIS